MENQNTMGSEERSTWIKLGIPEIFLSHDFSTWKGAKVDVPDGALILGPVGTGKTHLAVAKAKEIFRRGEQVRFWRAVDLLDRIKNEVLNGEFSEKSVYDYYSLHPHLVLDDIAVLNATAWVKSTLYRIIDYKWNHRIPMIITADKTPDELAKMLDDRIVSRICDMGAVIRLTGKDKRVYGVDG